MGKYLDSIGLSHFMGLIKQALAGKSDTGHSHSQYYDSGISRTANTVLAAPNGSAGGATFRKLVVADLPTGTTATTVALGNHDHSSLYLPLSGGTETGAVSFKPSNIDKANPSSSATWGNARINLQDKNGNNMAYVLPYVGTDGFYGMCLGCEGNYVYIRTDGSSPKTTFSNSAAWRTGLGLGSAATMNTGTTATTVALGNHTHTNYYWNQAQSATSVSIGNTSAYAYLIILFRTNNASYSGVQKGAATSPLNSTVVYINRATSGTFYASLIGGHKISATSVQFRQGLATITCGTSGTVTLSNQMYCNLGNGSSGTQEVGAQTDMALCGVIGVY